MKRIMLSMMCLVLLVLAVPAFAQDTPETTPEQTPAVEATPESTAAPSGMPTAGKWMLTWKEKTKSCPAENTKTQLVDRTVILVPSEDGKTILFDTLFWFGQANFEVQDDGTYKFIRNDSDSNGHFSFTYVLSDLTADSMTGTSTDYYPKSACPSLKTDFTLKLVKPNVTCIVGSSKVANLRSGPGTNFDVVDKLGGGSVDDVEGYGTAKDKSKWWKLASGGWVRTDLVFTAGACDDVPEVAA